MWKGQSRIDNSETRSNIGYKTRDDDKQNKKIQFRKVDDIIKSICGPLYTCS